MVHHVRAVDDDGAKQENKKGEVVWTCAVVLIFSSQLWSALKGLLAEDAIVSATTGLVDKCMENSTSRSKYKQKQLMCCGMCLSLIFCLGLSFWQLYMQWRQRIQPQTSKTPFTH